MERNIHEYFKQYCYDRTNKKIGTTDKAKWDRKERKLHFLRKKQFKTVFNNQTKYMYIQQTGAKVYLDNKCWSKVDSCKAGESIGRIKKKKEKERE